MKHHWKSAAILALFIPLFYKLTYIFDAWQYSPLDQHDFVFWLAAAAAFGIFLLWEYRRLPEKAVETHNYSGLLLLAAAIAVLFIGSVKHINTLYLAGSLLFIAGGCWLILGWHTLWFLLPVFFIAALGLPSTSYWTSFLFRNYIHNLPGFSIKLWFAAIALIWFLVNLRYSKKFFIRPEPFFFCLASAIFVFSYFQTMNPAPVGAPVHLAIKPEAGPWLGIRLPLSPLDASLRGNNIVERYVHYTNSNVLVSSMLTELHNDIHQVHPAALCLATARWKIISTTRELVKTKLGPLSLTKIVAEKYGRQTLFFTWYTNASFSTGSFLSFRKSWHFNEVWGIYQIATPVVTTDAEAEKILLSYINTFAIL